MAPSRGRNARENSAENASHEERGIDHADDASRLTSTSRDNAMKTMREERDGLIDAKRFRGET